MSEINAIAYEKTDRLTSSDPVADQDFLISNQSGHDRKLTVSQLVAFLTGGLSSPFTIDNITLDGNTISTSTGNLNLSAAGTVVINNITVQNNTIATTTGDLILSAAGNVAIDNLTLQNNTLATSSGDLNLSAIGNVTIEDFTLNSGTISTAAGDITLSAASKVVMDNLTFDTNTISTPTGNLILSAAANVQIVDHLTTPNKLSIGDTPVVNQGTNSTAAGSGSGETNQAQGCTSYGVGTGNLNQANFAAAFAFEAGKEDQGGNALAQGREAGKLCQGSSSLAQGRSAGRSNQGPNGMIFSATGASNNNTTAGHMVFESTLARLRYTGVQWEFDGGRVVFNDTLDFEGGMQMKITSITAATYTILKTDSMVFADTTTQAITLTLPAIVAGPADDGRWFRIQKVVDSLNSLTIKAQVPSTINSEATDTVVGVRNDALSYMAFNGNWFIINRDTNAFGSIELATPGATQGLTLTLTKLAIFDTNRFTTPGVNTADFVNDVVEITHIESVSLGGDGYRLGFRFEISGYSNNQDIGAEIFVNGVPTNIQDVQPTSSMLNTVLEADGLFQVSGSPQDVEVRIVASNVETATFETAQLITERLIK